MKTPLSVTIASEISAGLTGLTTDNGYNFSWGVSPSSDPVMASRWPYASLIALGSETCEDDKNAAWQHVYSRSRNVEIKIQSNSDIDELEPFDAAENYLEYAIDDVLRWVGSYRWATPAVIDI